MSIRNGLLLGLFLSFLLMPSLRHTARAEERPDTLTLSEALKLAFRNNPDLRKAELSVEAKDWEMLEALSEHLPHLTAQGTHLFEASYPRVNVEFGGRETQFPSAFPQTSLNLEASLLLFDGFGALNRYRASVFEEEAAQLELAHARFALEAKVSMRFNEALVAQELAKVAVQNIETLEQHLQLAHASQGAGLSTKLDVLRLEAQLEEAQAEKLLANDNVITARHALNELLGLSDEERPLEGCLPAPDPRRLPPSLTLDASKRQDLQAQSRHAQAQERLSAAAMGRWFPRLSLFGAEQFYKYGNFDPDVLPNSSFQRAYAFGLRLHWDLFDGGGTIARQQLASTAAKVASEDFRKQFIASPNEFDIWKRRYIYNAALFEARKRMVEKSKESVRLATIGIRAGTKTNSQALDAELELFRARAGVLRAQLEAAEAFTNLELALGQRL